MEFVRPIDSVVNDEAEQPSFFDLLAQSSFEKLLPPLVKPSLSTIFPLKADLIFYGVKAAIDLGMMANFGGITSEVVYGLERTRSSKKWLLYIVTFLENHLIPFLSETGRLTRFTSVIPESLKKLAKLLDALIKLAYITSDCKSFSLLHFITRITYKHSSTDIYERSDLLGRLVKTILIGGQLGIYLVQSGVFEKLRNPTNQFIIPSTAPDIYKLVPKPHPEGYPLPQRAGICPICLEAWKNPVALSSGVVYCRKCVKSDCRTCPVTRIAVSHFIPLFL